MNKRALKHILEHALQTLEESFTDDRSCDYGICGQISAAYHSLYSGVSIIEDADKLYFHTIHSQASLIHAYLRRKYFIDKSLGEFWWPIAQYSWQLYRPWAEEGRRTRVQFLKTAIADLNLEIERESYET